MYAFNNFYLKENSLGICRVFCQGYLNDFCAGIFILGFTNLLLSEYDVELKSLGQIVSFSTSCAFVWEFFAPAIKATSVTDWLDILMYILGGACYYYSKKIIRKI